MINVALLTYELISAGIQISGCNSDGIVWDLGNNEIQSRPDVAAIIAAHDPNKLTPQEQATKNAITEYSTLAAWAKTGTAADAEAYINAQVWNGQTIAQVNTWIDANITGTTVATLRTQVIAALKVTAGAIINMRGLFVLTAKLLIYIRDLVIRFRS